MRKFRVNEEDGALLRAMRFNYVYKGYDNSIIAWTVSEEWTAPRYKRWDLNVRADYTGNATTVKEKVRGATYTVLVGEFQVKELKNVQNPEWLRDDS
jgi:hypothetical protein